MTPQAWFDRLGAALEEAWRGAQHDEEAFPEIARKALEDHPPGEAWDRDAFVRECLDPRLPARRQHAPVGAFGQPSFTVFHGGGFLIDVYFWTNSLSAIHNHPFCGLFVVLEGFSLHSVYEFEERERLGGRLRIGGFRQKELSVVEAMQPHLFSLRRHPLIHALLHVPVGAVSMVIRTARTEGYLRYFPPAFATVSDFPDDVVLRRIELLGTLRQAGDPAFPQYLHAFLEAADVEESFIVLSRLWSDCDPNNRTALAAHLRARHGAHGNLVPAVLSRNERWGRANALRERIHDADDRFVAATLMLAESRSQALAVLGARHSDPVARLHRFAAEVHPFPADDPAAPVLAHALIDGLDAVAAERKLRETFGEAGVPEGQREIIEAHQQESLFAALACPEQSGSAPTIRTRT